MVDGTGLKGISTLHFLNRVFPCKLSNAPFLFLISNVISTLSLHQEVGRGKGAFNEICAFKRSSIHLKIEKDDDGTVVAYSALRQTCNPPGFGFCSHCLVGLDSNESGSFSENAGTRREQRSKQLSAITL